MPDEKSTAHPLLGALVLAIGAGIMAVGAGLFPSQIGRTNAPLWVILAAGACFALAGLAVLCAGRLPKALAGLIPCLLLTLFTAIPAWVAFGDGPREFSMSLSGFGLSLWWEEANLGRIVFGAAALLMLAVTVFGWIAWWLSLSLPGRVLALVAAPIVGWLLLGVLPAEPRWGAQVDDHERLARYGEAGEREGWLREARRGRPIEWAYPPWRNLEAWSKAARSRLAAAREAPADARVLTIPVVGRAPRVDGVIDEDEWQGALVLPLADGDPRARARMLSDGARLYLAGEVPADTTPTGYDQFRFWYHLRLSPAMPYERAFLDGSGGVNVLRSVVFPYRNRPDHERSAWHTHRKARGASTVAGFRRYELALDLDEAGLHRGVPFPASIDVEGDPVRDANGKFRSRTEVGRHGSLEAPVWLRITP